VSSAIGEILQDIENYPGISVAQGVIIIAFLESPQLLWGLIVRKSARGEEKIKSRRATFVTMVENMDFSSIRASAYLPASIHHST
jgi:hypothetical protein